MITMTVKGDKLTAARTAADRGIPFTFVRENLDPHDSARTTTTGQCSTEHRGTVSRWFCEAGSAPFRRGTLLLYTMKETP